MRNHQTTATLQQILAEPSLHSPSVVARAARELSLRGQGEEALFERKVRLSARAALIVGAFCLVWPVLILGLVPRPPAHEASASAPFLFRHFDAMFFYVGVFQAVVGALLLLGGLLTARRRPAGRVLVLVALFFVLSYVVAFTLMFAATPFGEPFPLPFAVIFVAFAVVNASIFGFLLWLPIRFFLSPRVRSYCRAGAA